MSKSPHICHPGIAGPSILGKAQRGSEVRNARRKSSCKLLTKRMFLTHAIRIMSEPEDETGHLVDATAALESHSLGNPQAAAELMPLVYDDLRKLAARYMSNERPEHTLQPTALVHEAYLRLIDINRIDWNGKTHFFAMAARQMRRILTEHARMGGAKKRGGEWERVTLGENIGASPGKSVDLFALEEALESLCRKNSRQGQVAELRLLAGMSEDEIANVLGVSRRTVSEDWRVARARLSRDLAPIGPP